MHKALRKSLTQQMTPLKWSEKLIAGALVRGVFESQVIAVPRCNWTGNECDILIVTKDLRIIDVEIKIDRSDLKADVTKDKWWRGRYGNKQPLDHPPKVWKHYYAMPRKVWKDDFAELLPKNSGIILLDDRPERTATYGISAFLHRRPVPNRQATKISAEAVLDIARLSNLRLWAALSKASAATVCDVLA